jgi:hypothetical protein
MDESTLYRLKAPDGRFAGYGGGPHTASLGDASTAYVFRGLLDAEGAAAAFEPVVGGGLVVEEYLARSGRLRVGDRVRFGSPATREEAAERYEVLEMRGDRLLAKFLDSGMRIEPTFVLVADDLIPAND